MENTTEHRRHLYLTTVIVSMCYAAIGCAFAWTSPTLPRLMSPESNLHISDEQGSWVGSIIAIGGTVGPFVAGKLLDILGRKVTILLNTSLLFVSWIVLYLASCVEILYIGRFISGFAVGVLFIALINYIAEVSDDRSRGLLSSTTEFSLAIGFNIQYFCGPCLSYENLIIINSMIPLIFIASFIWLPETPYYLISKKKDVEAVKSIRWFRGGISQECAEKEAVLIESTMFEMMRDKKSFWQLIKIPGNRKALYITCFLMASQEFCGINVLQLYSENIFMDSGSYLRPSYCAMIVGAFQFVASSIAGPLTKRFGYKKLLLIGCVFIAVEHFILGLYFYCFKTGKDVSSFSWLPVTGLVFFILTYSSTLGPLPWGVVGEIFPTNFKASASSVVAMTNFSTTFLVTKFFTNITTEFGMYTSFWIFTVSMIISVIFIALVQPDTKGMSLQDIQDKLNNKPIVNPHLNPS